MVERLQLQEQPVYPAQILRAAAEERNKKSRRIEEVWWFEEGVRIDYDFPGWAWPENDRLRGFFAELSASLNRQGHPWPSVPRPSVVDKNAGGSSAVLSYFEVPDGSDSLFDRVPEVPDPLIRRAGKHFGYTELPPNYTVVMPLREGEDVANMPKRLQETLTRKVLAGVGALKAVYLHPEYAALATMEGGIGVEYLSQPSAIDRFRDRIVTHTIAKQSGGFEEVENAISEENWLALEEQKHVTDAFAQLGKWGYVDEPFDLRSVVSEQRAYLIQRAYNWMAPRQSESAGAKRLRASIALKQEVMEQLMYPRIGAHMETPAHQPLRTPGIILATGTGRYDINKRDMNPYRDITPVTIIPRADHDPERDFLNLYAFERYALGIGERIIVPPSIEFDEMAVAFYLSEWIEAFLHIHQQTVEIKPKKPNGFGGRSGTELVKYIHPNMEEYPYAVGCGKDIMFAITADAVRRFLNGYDPRSGIVMVVYDAFNHGTNLLILKEALKYSSIGNPFEAALALMDPNSGVLKLTEELVKV